MSPTISEMTKWERFKLWWNENDTYALAVIFSVMVMMSIFVLLGFGPWKYRDIYEEKCKHFAEVNGVEWQYSGEYGCLVEWEDGVWLYPESIKK